MKIKRIVGAVCGSIIKTAILIGVVIAIYRGAILAYDYGYRVFMEPAVSIGEGRSITIAITEDMTALEIGDMFALKGLVRDGRLFAVQYLLSEYRKDVKPGVFELSTSMTAEEMMEFMAKESGTDEEE
jgi:UPF0755 protein